MAWHGMAWHGMAWHGMAWYGIVQYNSMVWYGMAWHGTARCGMVRRRTTRHDDATCTVFTRKNAFLSFGCTDFSNFQYTLSGFKTNIRILKIHSNPDNKYVKL